MSSNRVVRVYRDDAAGASIIKSVLDYTLTPAFAAFVFTYADGFPAGAFAFTNLSTTNVEVTLCSRGVLTPRVVRFIARQAFEVLRVSRATTHTRVSNIAAQKAIEAVGFKREGVARGFFGDEDAVSYGMLKSEQKLVRLG